MSCVSSERPLITPVISVDLVVFRMVRRVWSVMIYIAVRKKARRIKNPIQARAAILTKGKGHLCVVDVRSIRCVVEDDGQRAWDVIPAMVGGGRERTNTKNYVRKSPPSYKKHRSCALGQETPYSCLSLLRVLEHLRRIAGVGFVQLRFLEDVFVIDVNVNLSEGLIHWCSLRGD